MKLDDSINWRAMIKSGSRLDEAMKATNIYFPPAVTDALQDQYDATYVHLFGKVSKETVKIECKLIKGIPEYKLTVPMFEKSLVHDKDEEPRFPVISHATIKGRWDSLTPAIKNIKEQIYNAKKEGNISQDVYTDFNSSEFEISGKNLQDVMKVASEFYLAKHAPQYAVDYEKIIATGVDERSTDATAQGSWVDRTKGGEGKDTGHGGPG